MNEEELKKATKILNEAGVVVWVSDRVSNLDKLEKENKQLKEQNEFLIKRENKLQQIEMMFKNRNVDLEELSNLILEVNR